MEKELKINLYQMILDSRSQFSNKELNLFKKTLAYAVTLPGKKVAPKYFAEKHPKAAETLRNIKAQLGLQKYLSANLLFILAHGKTFCCICNKSGFFFPGGKDRPNTSKPILCSKHCASLYAVAQMRKHALKTHGVSNFFGSKEFNQNRVKYLQQKYGDNVTAPLLVPGANAAYRTTSQLRYGVDHTLKSEIVRQKQYTTHVEKYGTHFLASDKNRRLLKESSQAKWGVNHPSQSPKIKELKRIKWNALSKADLYDIKHKKEVTSLKKYGNKYPMQNVEVFTKSKKSRFTTKLVSWRNTEIYCQGYESEVLKHLESLQTISKVTTDTTIIGSITYAYRGKQHTYYPDIGVKKINGEKFVIEVKSTFTLGLGKANKLIAAKNKKKFLAASKHYSEKGIKFLVVLFHKNKLYKVPEPYSQMVTNVRKMLKL